MAFVLDQLGALGGIVAKPMFGGAGFYCDGDFFAILFKERLYFRVSDDTIAEYKARKMKPFKPFEGKGTSRNYYEVPVEILESPEDLVTWARSAVHATAKKAKRRDLLTPEDQLKRSRHGR